jgi:hypothetical protein
MISCRSPPVSGWTSNAVGPVWSHECVRPVVAAATGRWQVGDWRFVPLHRRNKPIAAARQGLDESRGLSRVPERFAQPLHGRVHAVLEIDERVVLPEPLPQFLAGDQLAWAAPTGTRAL